MNSNYCKNATILLILSLILFISFPRHLHAQCYSAAGLTIIKTVPDPITNFDFSYLDLTQSGAGPQLFTLQVLKGGMVYSNSCPKYKIHLTINTETNVISDVVYEGESGAFTMTHDIILTSNDFFVSQGDTMPSLNHRIKALENDAIQKILLNTATVPTGKLFFKFRLDQVSPSYPLSSQAAEIMISIANIRYLKLIAPGMDASHGNSYVPEIFTPYPQFLWQSDLMSVNYNGTVKFIVSVYGNPDEAYPVSEITSTKPLWTADLFNTNFAQYPVSGVKPLLPGQRYFWQVTGMLQGPVNSSIKSELYAFKVADWNISALSPTEQDILKYLEMILGSNYAYLMKDIRAMKPDETIILDNKKITLGELGDLSRNFALSKMALKKVTLK